MTDVEHVRTVQATRYVTPLREGGSLPAIVEGDDLGTYVLKFRGAGQGPKVLVAELVAGQLGRLLGLPVPEIVLMELDPVLGRSEPDPEIQDLIEASSGLNFGMDYLPGSLAYEPALSPPPDSELASAIVWFDALITNVDRTARNTNMLLWHRSVWLIDHGSSLFFHYGSSDWLKRSQDRFPQIKDHVLLGKAEDIAGADERLAPLLTPERIDFIVAQVPDLWLADEPEPADQQRAAYSDYFHRRLSVPRPFVEEAVYARRQL